jgi:regulator of protease activity HflC (stomatin/prohibitin superfamily)
MEPVIISRKKYMGYYQLIIAVITLSFICWIALGKTVDDGGMLMIKSSGRITALIIPGILFIISCYYAIAYFFQYRKPGLVIDSTGITDQSNYNALGLIPWSDIKEIEKRTLLRRDFLLIRLSDPEKYISRVKNPFRRKSLIASNRLLGTPLAISVRELNCSFSSLENSVNQAYEVYRVD